MGTVCIKTNYVHTHTGKHKVKLLSTWDLDFITTNGSY